MCENEDNATWVLYADQLKDYLLKDSTKSVVVYGREGHKVEYRRVTHGRWESCGKCSICGGDAPFWPMASTYYRSNYCPHCGNPLDEVSEEDK